MRHRNTRHATLYSLLQSPVRRPHLCAGGVHDGAKLFDCGGDFAGAGFQFALLNLEQRRREFAHSHAIRNELGHVARVEARHPP